MEAEHDYCRSERDKLKAKLACADMEVTTLRARIEALEGALETYGEHKKTWGPWGGPCRGPICHCGLSAVLPTRKGDGNG